VDIGLYITVDTRKYNIIHVCRMPEIRSEIGDMEYKHLNSSVHRVVSLIKVLNQNPQFQHLNT